MSSEDDKAAQMEAALREQWFGKKAEPEADAFLRATMARTVIEVSTQRIWNSTARDIETVLYRRVLGGSRVEIMRTRDEEKAKAEVARWREAGAKVEKYQQWR